MVKGYFGLPGCGKTTMLAKLAVDASRPRSPYKHIYGNVCLTGVPNYIQIKSSDLGRYDMHDALILLDEATVYFDNREYKNFQKCVRDFVMLHRHFNVDICLFMQSFNACDKSFRSIMDRLYMIKKPFFTGFYRSKVWRIPYDIIIPDRKDTGSAHLGEIVEGYCKPNFLARLLSPSLKRRRYYKYFDSWERPVLEELPADRLVNQSEHNQKAYDNLCNMLKDLPRKKIFTRYKLTKFKKRLKKALTS